MNIALFLKKIKNTFFTPRYKKFYRNYDSYFVKNKKKKFIFNIFSRIWFIPIDVQARYWHSVTKKDPHNYLNYFNLDYDAKTLIKYIVKYANKKNDKILDLGCNVGRHLNCLKKKKFINLSGVDINKFSIKFSQKIFPSLKKTNLFCNSFENFLVNHNDNTFDIIYTHGATIEMVKPTFDIVCELSRVVKKYLIFLINFNGHKYPRFWSYEFAKNGLKLIKARKFNNDQILLVYKK
jgi:SAM-dependent methyltransferase